MYCQTLMLLNGIDGTMILYHASCEEDPDLPWPAVTKQHLMDGEKEHSLYKTGHSTWSTSAETHRNRCHLVPVKTGLDGTSHANTSLQCFDLDKHGAGMHYYKHTETVCIPINSQGCHWCILCPVLYHTMLKILPSQFLISTTPSSERSLQASLQQQIPVKVRWY